MLHQSSSPASGRARASRSISYLITALALAGVGLFTPACDGGSGGTGGNGGGGDGGGAGDCEAQGGVIVNGVCEGKCTPDKCIEGNTCVGNRCVLKCESHLDCYPDGSQECAPAVEDDTNATVNVCQFHGKSPGIGTKCPFGGECGSWFSCPNGGNCFPGQCGGDPAACVLDQEACKDVEGCTLGKCVADGAPCRVNCQTECKEWLECETKGEADADAYCVNRDCATDDDCLDGYYCGIIRDPHEICGSSPKKGDNNFCGQTSEPCIAVGSDGKATDGTSRFEGSLCMLRRSCLKREQAAPCTTDLDCSLVDGQKCISFAGETRCAQTCGVSLDCALDYTCDVGLGACVPRFGAWIGTGQFCEPCLSDEDCGGVGSSVACSEISGGMLACFDQAFPDTCNTDADCPKSPSGKPGTCLDEGEGLGPGDSVYKRCYFPINASTNKTSCW